MIQLTQAQYEIAEKISAIPCVIAPIGYGSDRRMHYNYIPVLLASLLFCQEVGIEALVFDVTTEYEDEDEGDMLDAYTASLNRCIIDDETALKRFYSSFGFEFLDGLDAEWFLGEVGDERYLELSDELEESRDSFYDYNDVTFIVVKNDRWRKFFSVCEKEFRQDPEYLDILDNVPQDILGCCFPGDELSGEEVLRGYYSHALGILDELNMEFEWLDPRFPLAALLCERKMQEFAQKHREFPLLEILNEKEVCV